MQIDYVKLIVSIVICLLMGFIAGMSTSKSIDSWYSKIKKPSFNPPNWIFGPVWTILYVLMGISLYLMWTSKIDNRLAIMFFVIQLVLNFLWSYLFFSMHNPLLAFIDIALLWIMIILTMIYAYPVSQTASLLMIPYILWVTFASILNLSIYLLNK
ncbi:TPA: tryptophan-rich sensory protein [Candidatus Woesearchaeota archaeon]|nr:tryptophan-rich sensory protein [Candidatus Woesearchaeota archaeon]HIH32055.1 tryptophan-rich sensory protein [Candidatus Woesearchaeota archaeon]HIH54999.1 tryptophan-rich sensory protein [Candidatus Woesearchaeota archaeon]HIJ01656.1 tryptophan-rich sensory protein [Candidatus Woesearchaeota archaeon]HIJ13350.1 tryptophan-rich sensory protein [Candidatus Woesearchaeota archaeon]